MIGPYELRAPQESSPWDNVTACNFGGSPESVGTFRPTFAPQFSVGSALSAGVIAGVVAATTVTGLAAIVVGVWYLVRRRRRRRTPIVNNNKLDSLPSGDTSQDKTGYTPVPWTPQSATRFYVRATLFACNRAGRANDIAVLR